MHRSRFRSFDFHFDEVVGIFQGLNSEWLFEGSLDLTIIVITMIITEKDHIVNQRQYCFPGDLVVCSAEYVNLKF